MKFIKRLLISLIVIIAIVSLSVIGIYIYARSTYGIDLFNTVNQLKVLTQEVDEDELFPNAFSDEDLQSLKQNVDGNVEGLIKYDENTGYNGYSIDYEALKSVVSVANFKFEEKQIGALAQTSLATQSGGVIALNNGQELKMSIIQVDFQNISATGDADFNIVVKLDLSPLKQSITGFLSKYLNKYIPNCFYISSTVSIEKTEVSFGYNITHKSLTLNKLSSDDTKDLFHTLDTILKIGTEEELNMLIGTTAVDLLIGNEENNGFIYSLKTIGKTSFSFISENGQDYLVVS